MSNKWVNIVEDEKHSTYYEALGLTEKRAHELMDHCKAVIQKNTGSVSMEWSLVLPYCNSIEEVVFVIYKLGEHAGGSMVFQDLFTPNGSEDANLLKELVKAVVAGDAKVMKVMKVDGLGPFGREKGKDDTEIKGPEHY